MHLMSYVCELFNSYLKKFERNYFNAFDLHCEMQYLRPDVSRLEKKFCGIIIRDSLIIYGKNAPKKFLLVIENIYSRSLEYLEMYYDFKNSPFKKLVALKISSREKRPTRETCESIAKLLVIKLNYDYLFDELTVLEQFLKLESSTNIKSKEMWAVFFVKLIVKQSQTC